MSNCQDFTELSLCPKGLRCQNKHDYDHKNLKDPHISRAFDIIFTYLFDERKERLNLIKDIKEIKNMLQSGSNNSITNEKEHKAPSMTKALTKLSSIEERLSRLEATIKSKGLPLRAADLTFNQQPLKIKHSDSSILGRGEAISGKSMMIKRNNNQATSSRKVCKTGTKTGHKSKIKKKSTGFIVTPQKDNINISAGCLDTNSSSSSNIIHSPKDTTSNYIEIMLNKTRSTKLASPSSSTTSRVSKGISKKSLISSIASKLQSKNNN